MTSEQEELENWGLIPRLHFAIVWFGMKSDKRDFVKAKGETEMKHTNDLGKDPVWQLVIKLAVPAMIAQLVNVLYSIIDRMYIGNIKEIGDVALAGVGVCGPIVTLLSSFGTLVGLGGSILLAMRLGEKKQKEASQILANSFFLLILFSVVLTVLFLLTKNQLLRWFGASETTFQYANTYMTIYTIGTFFAIMALGLNYFITCQGFATIGMMTVVIGAVSNILLDPLFIFGFHLEVAGAAIATVLSQMISFAFALLFLFGKKIPVHITFGGYSANIMKKIIALGLSPFLILATDSVILIVMNAMLQRYGGAAEGDLYVSCNTIIQSYLLLITGPMVGISGGTQAIISYNYGARASKRIRSAEKWILLMCLAFTTVMTLVSRLAPQYFVRVFTDNPEHIRLSIWGIQTVTMAVIPLSFQYVFVDGLTALGRTKTALSLSMFRKSIYCLFTVIFPMLFLTKGTFYAEPVADVISACVSTAVFFMVFEKHLAARESAR